MKIQQGFSLIFVNIGILSSGGKDNVQKENDVSFYV